MYKLYIFIHAQVVPEHTYLANEFTIFDRFRVCHQNYTSSTYALMHKTDNRFVLHFFLFIFFFLFSFRCYCCRRRRRHRSSCRSRFFFLSRNGFNYSLWFDVCLVSTRWYSGLPWIVRFVFRVTLLWLPQIKNGEAHHPKSEKKKQNK